MTKTTKLSIPALFLIALTGAGCGSSGSGLTVPAAPSNLMVAELEGGAHLTWKDNSDNESAFMLERKVGTAAYATLTTVPFNTTQYHDPNLTPATLYTYHVMAMGKEQGKDSDFSNEVTFMLGGSTDGGADGSSH